MENFLLWVTIFHLTVFLRFIHIDVCVHCWKTILCENVTNYFFILLLMEIWGFFFFLSQIIHVVGLPQYPIFSTYTHQGSHPITYMCFVQFVATYHMCLFNCKLTKINDSVPQSPCPHFKSYVACGCQMGQCRYRIYPSSQKFYETGLICIRAIPKCVSVARTSPLNFRFK